MRCFVCCSVTRLFARWLLVVGLAGAPSAWGASNFNSTNSLSWGANIGWLNWRGDGDRSAGIDPYICVGFIYSPNVGWINLGNGTPANRAAYQNNSATDFGVNVDAQGNLRGLAYGANIGWINFEATGLPRLDLRTGRLSGHIYSANTGWIALGDSTSALQLDFLPAGGDSDGDGIPDAWEINAAGGLAVLGANNDADKDGSSDLEEYLADTNPLDPSDHLRILQFSLAAHNSVATLTWTTRSTRLYTVQTRLGLSPSDAWVDSGLGLLTPNGTTLSRDLPGGASGEQRYFRIQAVRPLSR